MAKEKKRVKQKTKNRNHNHKNRKHGTDPKSQAITHLNTTNHAKTTTFSLSVAISHFDNKKKHLFSSPEQTRRDCRLPISPSGRAPGAGTVTKKNGSIRQLELEK